MTSTTRHMQQHAGQGRGESSRRARTEGQPIIVLAGRPYHVDPEINHGINQLITSLGLRPWSSEDCVVSCYEQKFQTHGAEPVDLPQPACTPPPATCTTQPDMDLVQLVSFGCGRGRHHHRRDPRHPARRAASCTPR